MFHIGSSLQGLRDLVLSMNSQTQGLRDLVLSTNSQTQAMMVSMASSIQEIKDQMRRPVLKKRKVIYCYLVVYTFIFWYSLISKLRKF